MLELQNIILEMVARAEDLAIIADRLCRNVEARVPGIICSMLLVEPPGILRPLAAPSLPPSYCSIIDGMSAGPDVGACGSAAYHGRALTVLGIDIDPAWEAFHPIAHPLGLRACWSSPVKDGQNRVIGTFAFYFREARGPTLVEESLVETCLHLCSIAITNHAWRQDQERLASTDGLTGLPNRAAFNRALTTLACDQPSGWAILILDLDNLKIVNDSFGHHSGDMVIMSVAERLAKAASPESVYRLGGDEFAVIIHSSDHIAELDRFAARLITAVGTPLDCAGHVVVPRATAGAAIADATDRHADHVRRNADFALYHAKETNRGGFVRYWPGIGSRITRRLDAIREVDIALREDRIDAFYQPIVQLGTGEIMGFEALCRMRIGAHVLPASAFHDATTDVHVATRLTERMLEIVASDIRSWDAMELAFDRIAINVSSADFHGKKLCAQVNAAFSQCDGLLDRIVLEVTEAVYINQPDLLVTDVIQQLQQKGIRIALDDFGTGYASLTHLLTVPVDIVKIDKSFVDRLVEGDAGRVIVEGILHIARGLDMEVVAEGIEAESQADMLHMSGCQLGQGYFFARPLDRKAATELLALQANRDKRLERAAHDSRRASTM